MRSETKKVDGKDETFIFLEQEIEDPMSINEHEKIEDYEKAYFKLKLKYSQLQVKYDDLMKKI